MLFNRHRKNFLVLVCREVAGATVLEKLLIPHLSSLDCKFHEGRPLTLLFTAVCSVSGNAGLAEA